MKHVMDILTLGQRPNKDDLRKGLLNLVNLQGWDEAVEMELAAMFTAAVNELGEATRFSLPQGDYSLAVDLTIPAASALLATPGVTIEVAAGATLTVSGQFGAWIEERVFSGLGTIEVSGGVWLPGWFVDRTAQFSTIAADSVSDVADQVYLLPETPEIQTIDDLTTISGVYSDGQRIMISPIRFGDTLTVRHGAGNIQLVGAADLDLLGPADKLVLRWDQTAEAWVEFARLLDCDLSHAEQAVVIAQAVAEAGAGIQMNDIEGLPAALAERGQLGVSNIWQAAQRYPDGVLTSDAGVVNWDMQANPEPTLLLTEDVTSIVITNPGNGELTLQQDATGGWSVAWPAAIRWPGGTAPELTLNAGAEDVITFSERNGVLRGMAVADFKAVA